MKVVRFGVSVEQEVLDVLDNYMLDNKLTNRSQAIRHLITKADVSKQFNSDQIVGGTILLSYDHHKRELLDKITDIQHNYHKIILGAQHVHLDHHTCMEIIAIKGKASELKALANELIATKGIIHGDLSITGL